MPQTTSCEKGISFQECELAILRTQVDQAKEKMARRVVNSPDIKHMVSIVEEFLEKKKLICYGGTALNNILPEEDQFYDRETEIADYDFFSPNALEDTKELADIFHKNGYEEVEAKAGTHHGTYKVFVNFLGIADITYLPKELFDALKKEAIPIAGILYAPPNYLRMSIYLELSRPAGDVDRWTKVWERLQLLNKNYPLELGECQKIQYQRPMAHDVQDEDIIYDTVKSTLVNQGVVFFGGYAISEYSKYMPKNLQKKLGKIPDFDVIARHPKMVAEILKERLHDVGVKNVKIVQHDAIGEIVPENYEVIVGKEDTLVFIYAPVACHSYNVIKEDGKKIRIATIDTMLSFYLAFIFAPRKIYQQFRQRILCMAKFLFDVQQKNRLKQKGLLKRFSILCYGHQDTKEDIRAQKAKKFKELEKDSSEYEEWFLRYRPSERLGAPKSKSRSTRKAPQNKRKTKKRKSLFF